MRAIPQRPAQFLKWPPENQHAPGSFRGRLKQIVWQHKRYSYEPYRIVTIRLNSA
jgi:hypothetical protein